LKRVSMGFVRGRSPLYGCAKAIDGIVIKVVEPWNNGEFIYIS
jgi:hypothetical protein